MMLNKALRFIVLGGIFLLPFIPFVISQSMFFPFITGKNFAFRILSEIVVGGWLILLLRDVRYRIRTSWVVWALTAFVVVIFIADVFGADFGKSFWSNFERMEGFVTLLHLFGYVLAVGSMLQTEKLWTRLLQTSVGASVLMSIYGFFQLAGVLTINQGGVRVDGTFGNATYLAVYMLFHVFLTLYLIVRHRGAKLMYGLYGVAVVCQLIMLYYTATRGAILGLVGGLFLSALLVALFGREEPRLRKASIGALIALLVLIGGFFAVRNTSFVEESKVLSRFATISYNDDTTRSRIILWGIAWEGVKEHPILGTGQENFESIFGTYYDPRMYDQEQWFDRAHNVIFDWFTAGGTLGLLTYLSIFGAVLVLLWHRGSTFSVVERSVVTGLLAAYFFHNLFVFDNVVSYLFFGAVLALVHARAVYRGEEVPPHPTLASPYRHGAAIAVALLAIAAFYYFNVPGVRASRALVAAIRSQGGGLMENLSLFDRAIGLDTYGTPEARERLLLITQQFRNRSDVTPEIAQAFLARSLTELNTQLEETPESVRATFLGGSFLNAVGMYDESIAKLNRALELSPAKQSIMTELAGVYLNAGKPDEALAIAKRAFDLGPQFDTLRKFYAAIAIRTGHDEIAEELLVSRYGTALLPDDLFINTYAAVGNLPAVEALWRMRVAEDPTNIQAYVSLAATLLEEGRRTESIEVLEQAIAADSSFAARGQEFIDAIRSGKNL
ncbi:O-antigen ligase family protein [Candidatus Wolfebacteria bacterium]|nr:O-antigen ligase family protein [Candidatus Wolfebacteria bacterium]